MKLKLDLHIHSEFSYDSNSKLNEIISFAKKKKLDGIAITDHETFDALKFFGNKKRDLIIIGGQEVDTEYGDIIGLFLSKKIKSKKFLEVVKEIRKQNGIVVLPHPAKYHILTDVVMKNIDAVEVFNSRLGDAENNMALFLSEKFKKRKIVGSDAHYVFEIGNGVCVVDSKSRKLEDIKKSILLGKISFINKRPSKFVRGFILFCKIWRNLWR